MIFGDSIAYGANDNELCGWSNRLRMHLENHENYFIVYNLSISGEFSTETLARFENECNARYDKEENTIIIFALGINDTQVVNGKDRISLKEFESNIKELKNLAKKFTNNILFLGMTKVDETKVVPIPWKKSVSFFNEKIIKYDSLLEQICNEEKVSYIKLYDLLSLDELPDGLHPNNIGHKKIYDVILNKINQII